MNRLIDELMQQPTYLRRLVEDYRRNNRIREIRSMPLPQRWTLTGTGASFHAAWIGSLYLNSLGIPANAIEATDLVNYHHSLQQDSSWMVYVSQSGSSGEITPFLDCLSPTDILLSVTNNPNSELARQGALVPADGRRR